MGLSQNFEQIAASMVDKDGHAKQALPFDHLMKTQDIATKTLGQFMLELRFATDADLKLGKPKKLERALDKIRDDYKGDSSLICDLARGKMIVDSPEQIAVMQDILSDPYNETMQNLGIFVVQESDYFKTPKNLTGYSCLNYKIAIPVGEDDSGETEYHISELQVVAEQIEAVAKQSHYFKREAENLIAQGEMGPSERHLAAAYFGVARGITAKVRHEHGYDELLENQGRHGFSAPNERKFNMWSEKLRKLLHDKDVVESYAKDQALRSEEGGFTYAMHRSKKGTEFFRYTADDPIEDSKLQRLSAVSNTWVPAGELGGLATSRNFTSFKNKLQFDMERIRYLTGVQHDDTTHSGKYKKVLESIDNG